MWAMQKDKAHGAFAELCRKATNKELGNPSVQYNQHIVNYITSGKVPAGKAAEILAKRLEQKNPWKVTGRHFWVFLRDMLG